MCKFLSESKGMYSSYMPLFWMVYVRSYTRTRGLVDAARLWMSCTAIAVSQRSVHVHASARVPRCAHARARRPGCCSARSQAVKPPARRIVLHCHRRVEHNLRLAGVRASVLLFEAASEGDTDKLRTLLDKDKYDVDWRGEQGMSPVHVAALHNHAECVKLLIKAGAKVNQCDNDGWTPLMAAAAFAEHKMVEMLLNEGANPTRRIQKGHHKGMNARDLVKDILESKGSMATKCLALLEGVPCRCRYSIQIRMCCALKTGLPITS